MAGRQWISFWVLVALIHEITGGGGQEVINGEFPDNVIVQELMERLDRLEQQCVHHSRHVRSTPDVDAAAKSRHVRSTGEDIADESRHARSTSDVDATESSRHAHLAEGNTILENLPGHSEALKQAKQAVFIPHPDSTTNHKQNSVIDDTGFQKQLQMVIAMVHKQSAQFKNDHAQLKYISSMVQSHMESMEHVVAETEQLRAENQRLDGKVQHLQTSLDLYKLSHDNFVNHTNGVIKRMRLAEQNVEGLYGDQAGILQKIDDLNHTVNRQTKGYRRLNQRLQQLEKNVTEYKRYGGYNRVEGAARKIDGIDVAETDVSPSINGTNVEDTVRLGKKYKKLNKQLEDTTQKLYRLSNYVSDYTTALQIIESGQDVGMRNDEYLADNQIAIRNKLTDMETKLQDVYLHYREDLRRHGGILPEEVAPTFESDQALRTTSAPSAGYTLANNQVTVQQQVTSGAVNPGSETTTNPPSLERTTSERMVGGSTNKVTQYYITPEPSSSRWSNSHKTRDVSGSNAGGDVSRYTPDPRISKRTTEHLEQERWENTVPRPGVGDSGMGDQESPSPTVSSQPPGGAGAGSGKAPAGKDELGISVSSPTLPQPRCHVSAVGPPKPIAFRGDFISGTWLRDDGMPGSPIYVTTGSDEFRQVLVYHDLWHLINNNYSSVITLPFHCAGSGHVIYLGSIYCNKKNSNRLMRYDFSYKVVTSQKLFKAGYNNTYPYTTGLATDLDFAVDESGLWVTYGSTKHDGRLTAARLNPHTLDVQREWVIEFDKKDALNTFIVCGKVYIVVQNKDTVVAEVQLVYDTYTSTLMKLPKVLKLEGDSLYLTMLDYNPMESALHAWGLTRSWLGELLIYDLVVELDSN